MPSEDELNRLFAEQRKYISDIAAVLEPLATSIPDHKRRLDALMKGIEEDKRRWQDLLDQWQAYLNTLPKR